MTAGACVSQLAGAPQIRYEMVGDNADLAEAIKYARRAVQATEAGHRDRVAPKAFGCSPPERGSAQISVRHNRHAPG